MVILNIFLITLSINSMRYFFIENKISDSQEGAKLCLSLIFPDGEEVYNRQKKHQLPCTHGRATYSFLFVQIKDTIPCCRAGLSINIS